MAAKDKENAGERPRRSKLKIILIILFLIILLIGGAIAFWWFQLRQPGEGLMPASGTPAAAVRQEAAPAGNAQAGQAPQPAQSQPVTDMLRPQAWQRCLRSWSIWLMPPGIAICVWEWKWK